MARNIDDFGSSWDRSAFALTPRELDVDEAVRAMERLLDRPDLGESTLHALRHAVDVLRRDA